MRTNQPSESGDVETTAFPVRIDRRLSFIFGFLFVSVLFVGGSSLYLARSIYIASGEIKEESARIDLVDQMHYTIHHLISSTQRATLGLRRITAVEHDRYLGEIRTLLDRYRDSGAVEKAAGAEFRTVVDELESVTEGIITRFSDVEKKGWSVAVPESELKFLEAVERRMQALAHWLSGFHRAKMEQKAAENGWRMRIIVVFFAIFVVAGVLLVTASNFFFARTISRPLRRLVKGAREIASGNLERKVPVESKNEIGQLSHSFNVMAARLKENEGKLKGLATLQERERIAQELHDSLAQELALLQFKLNEAEEAQPPAAKSAWFKILEEMRQTTEKAYDDVRQAIFGLRTMVSKGAGFVPSLSEYLHDYSEMRRIPVALKISDPDAVRFSPQVEVQLIRIIHEALTNVFKHAGARRSVVKFEGEGDFTRVTIEDDGRGFAVNPGGNGGLHFGLKTMRERAEAAGGEFAVESSQDRGTKITVRLPLASKERHYGNEAHSHSVGG